MSASPGFVRSCVMVAAVLAAVPTAAQIPAEEYLHYMPLGYPSLVRQTAASERFHLFGDRSDPGYLDEQPRDGIDDRRGAWLSELSARFAPLMVRNTPLYPVDFRSFYERPGFALHVDSWNLAREDESLLDQTVIPFGDLVSQPCRDGAPADSADCRLREVIQSHGPHRTPLEPEATSGAEEARYSVMYFDFPGYDEDTWKEEYWPAGPTGDSRSQTLAGRERVFVHPFIAEVTDADGGTGYELVLQYWFFYPENDGPNNHEGDWEHVNVIVSPRSRVAGPLDEAGISAVLDGADPTGGADELVIRRIEYYLHHYVMSLDFASPNAYASRVDWDREMRAVVAAGRGSEWLWERIRERAWQDEAESRVNLRPVVWIGGDALGIQNVLDKPGLRDRDGHASYPFAGYYKAIGPGVGERVINRFDVREYFADPSTKPEYVEDYAVADRIALVPDWERIDDLVLTDPQVRREWSWLLLPVRFGYPATPSPAAGTIAHADMGNVSIVGPAFNGGWNRIGDATGYANYDAVKVSWATPMGMADSFFPRLGWFNAPILYFMSKPPLDLAWRSIALPVRAAFGSRLPTFINTTAPLERRVSFEVGTLVTPLSEDFSALFVNRAQLRELALYLVLALPPEAGGLLDLTQKNVFPTVVAPVYSLVFHISPRFSTESALASYTADVGFDIGGPGVTDPVPIRGRLEQFDYHGNTRFNLTTGRFKPYVKIGTGFTRYQLRSVSVAGVQLPTPDSPVFKPKGSWLGLGFNEFLTGGGLDIEGVRLGRARLGFKTSYTAIHHNLGFEQDADVEDSPTLAKQLAGKIQSVWRHQIRVLGSVGF